MKVTMAVFSILFILVPAFAAAGVATQTDWSGGDGVPGPVTDWTDKFDTQSDMNCSGSSGDLLLGKVVLNPPVKHTVAINFMNVILAYAADVDGDGFMDVLGAAGADDTIAWWKNEDGTGTSWTEHVIDDAFDGAYCVWAADVNDDGYMDVLGACRHDNDITWWENTDGTGTSWIEHPVDIEYDYAYCVYAADLNDDGYMDILGAAMEDDDITWWENTDGTGTNLIEHTIDGDYNGAHSVSASDIDDDGDMDVVGAARVDDDITWWENVNGLGTSWIEHTVDGDFNEAFSAFAADVNGDGYMDIAGAASFSDEISWWANENGSGLIWTKYVIDSNFDGANLVKAADLDADGDIDVMSAAYFGDEIAWWENEDGTGTSWTKHTIDGSSWHPRSAYAADINGDGNMDVVGSAFFDHDVSWYDIVEYSSEGAIESSILDTQEGPDWQTIDWTCTSPAGTSIAFQVRASDNFSSMGSWSDILTDPCNLDGILTDGDRYLQYRVILTSTDPLSTPVLEDVTVTWNPTGIEDGSGADIHALHGAFPNPSFNSTTLVFSLPADSRAELTVYDLTGRVVHSVSSEYEPGVHEIVLNDLACGVYLVRMTSGRFTAAQQFVVIEYQR